MDRNFALELIRVTEAAALAAAQWVGKGNAADADRAAIQACHHTLNSIDFTGKIVLGEGTRETAPLLYEGEQVGEPTHARAVGIDLALDSLECTRSVAFGRTNAMSVVAATADGGIYCPPTMYLEKIAVAADAVEAINFADPIADNLHRVAEIKGYAIHDLTVVILDRERHSALIEVVRKSGARMHLIPDGDLSACLAAAIDGTGIDMVVGTGATATGVLAAAAMRCLGGELLARLAPATREEAETAQQIGITDLKRVYRSGDLVHGGNVMFSATGVTDGDMLNGVRYRSDGATTHSLVLRSRTRTRRHVVTEHYFEDSPAY